MDKLVIRGGTPLNGAVQIGGAKNAAVAIIPAAILYMLFNMFYMCEKEAWKPVTFVIVAVVVTVAVYFLFRQFVYVKLPGGILKGVLG